MPPSDAHTVPNNSDMNVQKAKYSAALRAVSEDWVASALARPATSSTFFCASSRLIPDCALTICAKYVRSSFDSPLGPRGEKDTADLLALGLAVHAIRRS
jgi:hypothetical protein